MAEELESLIRELHADVQALSAANEALLTPAQVAPRLSMSEREVRRRMRQGAFPKGKVWWEADGIGVYFCWSRLVQHIQSPHRRAAEVSEADSDAVPTWRSRKRR